MSFKFGMSTAMVFDWPFSSGSLVPSAGVLEFVSTWNTEETGDSNDDQISLPLTSNGSYDFVVDWGDGTQNTITAWDDSNKTHTYDTPGIYEVKISGEIDGWSFNNSGDPQKLTEISRWGPLALGNNGYFFYGCAKLTISAPGAPSLTGVTTMTSAFRDCVLVDFDMSDWDMANVTNFESVFDGCVKFNQDISGWDTANVTTFSNMFIDCDAFNQDIGGWNTSSASNMTSMFQGCDVFDQDLGSWNIASLTDATDMFNGVTLTTANYDSLLIGWEAGSHNNDVVFHGGNSIYSAGTAARSALIADGWTFTDGGGIPFTSTWNTEASGTSNNQQITLGLSSGGTYDFHVDWGDSSSDDITAYDDPARLHTYASPGVYTVNITGQLEGWRTSVGGDPLKLGNISSWGPVHITQGTAFSGCSNMTCNATDVFTVASGGSYLAGMFKNCTLFNGDLGALNFNNAQSIATMFENCVAYNQDMSSWNTSNVVLANKAFAGCTALNQDLSSWNMNLVTGTTNMFDGCTSFNGDVSTWDMPLTTNLNRMFYGCTVFDRDVGSWNTTNVTDINFMLQNCAAFDQDLSSWDVESLTEANILIGGQLSTANYDALLIGWAAQTVQSGVSFHAGSSQYSAGAATVARASLVSDGWTITDGGPA